MYDIQACLFLVRKLSQYEIPCQSIPAGLDLITIAYRVSISVVHVNIVALVYARVELLLLVITPSCSHCPRPVNDHIPQPRLVRVDVQGKSSRFSKYLLP